MFNSDGMVVIQGRDPIMRNYTLDSFLHSSYSNLATGRSSSKEKLSFFLKTKNLEKEFIIVFTFRNSRLKELYLYDISDDIGAPFDGHPAKIEERRKQKHDALLLMDLGKGPYSFPWGRVESLKGNAESVSKIVITYR